MDFATENESPQSWTQHEGSMQRQELSDKAIAITMEMSAKYIAVSLNNKTMHIFNSDGEPLHVLSEHSGNVWSLALKNDTLLCGQVGGNIQDWDLLTGTLRRTYAGHSDTVRCLAFSSPTSFISASRDTTLKLWSLAAGDNADGCIATLSGHNASIVSLAVHHVSQLAVSGSQDGTCRVWNLAAQGACLATLVGHEGGVRAVAFFSEGPMAQKDEDGAGKGQFVVSGGVDGKVKVWNTGNGTLIATLDGHKTLVSHVLAVPASMVDGGTIITADADGAIIAWAIEREWRPRWTLTGAHEHAVTSLKAEGGCIVSGSSDGRVRVWEVETGRMLKEMGEKAEAVWSAGFKEGSQKGIVMLSRQSGLAVLDVWSS
ncbi:hypothetical protein MMC32_003521 [Xylographa parallela]|nr:hypothetical protein [Xylographa parallela]